MFLLVMSCSLIMTYFGMMYCYWGLGCINLYKASRDQKDNSEYSPFAAVILPLRGNDPYLLNCLDGLLNQEYAKYEVKIIVDHSDDPVLQDVDNYLKTHSHPHCKVSVLESRTGSCGLKNATLIQGLKNLDDEIEVVAWLDADVVPHSTWLSELVRPLKNNRVGVTSGIRWYAPRHTNAGTLVRYVWNAAAVLQMLAMDIAWGGSVAMSKQVFQNPALHESWSKMMWEDTYLKGFVAKMNLKLVFVPEATMVNEESITLKSCYHFITRQLMNVRYYHSSWLFIAGLGFFSTIAQFTLMILICLFLIQGIWIWLGISSAAITFASVSFVMVVCRLDSLIRQQVRKRKTELQSLSFLTLGVVWLTLFVYCAALFAATKTRRIMWRGVVYNAVSPFKIQIVHYEPYQIPETVSTETDKEKSSLV